jgi:hypothetical protein
MTFKAGDGAENKQRQQVFASEQLRLEEAHRQIRWVRPSDTNPDVVAPGRCPHELHCPLVHNRVVNCSRVMIWPLPKIFS